MCFPHLWLTFKHFVILSCSIDLTVSELRGKERKLTRQIEVIKKALSEIGCEELPNGCDLENSFEQGNDLQVRVNIVLSCSRLLNQFFVENIMHRYTISWYLGGILFLVF